MGGIKECGRTADGEGWGREHGGGHGEGSERDGGLRGEMSVVFGGLEAYREKKGWEDVVIDEGGWG